MRKPRAAVRVRHFALAAALPLAIGGGPHLVAPTGDVTVHGVDELRAAITAARPGTQIRVAPGTYAGDLFFADVRGRAGAPIVIAGAERADPPRFRGGACSLHFAGAEHLELRDLIFEGASGNGLNVDDGGRREAPAHHVVLTRLVVRDIGGRGNEDGIKLSGVDDFAVSDCTVARWGRGGGSAFDLVGCHRGRIEGCTFTQDGAGGGSGVQAKGGSAEIVIRGNRFDHAGERAVNAGGSTGTDYFRPPLGAPPYCEARNITVTGNTFLGSDAPIACVGVDGAVLDHNTIYRPRRHALRILQETQAPGFVPCRGGVFTRNLVVFAAAEWSEGGVNVGPGTEPASFRFAENWWYCVDAPARSRPQPPTAEQSGVVGRDPKFRDAAAGDLRLAPDSPARGYGAPARE